MTVTGSAPGTPETKWPLPSTRLASFHSARPSSTRPPSYPPTYASLCNPPKEREFVTRKLSWHCAASRPSPRWNIERLARLRACTHTRVAVIRGLSFAGNTVVTSQYDISFAIVYFLLHRFPAYTAARRARLAGNVSINGGRRRDLPRVSYAPVEV